MLRSLLFVSEGGIKSKGKEGKGKEERGREAEWEWEDVQMKERKDRTLRT